MTWRASSARAVSVLGPPTPFAVAVAAISVLSGPGAYWLIAVTFAGVVFGELLRRFTGGGRGAFWVLPPVFAVALATALSTPSLTTELFAGVAGLTLLYWIAAEPGERAGISRPSTGLLLPGLSVALALLVTQFLTGGVARLGIASALLVLVLLALGWAVRSERGEAPGEALPS
jgi:hypothetical protein